MITSFKLKCGRVAGALGEPVNTTPVTVFVGPNNSGKSKVLSEIERYCRTGEKDPRAVILEDVCFSGLSATSADLAIERISQLPHLDESLQLDHIIVGSRNERQQVPLAELRRHMQLPTGNLGAFCHWFLKHNTLSLDGRNRINLVNEQEAGDLQRPAQSSLQVLFRDEAKRQEVRRIIADAFETFFVIDPTNLGRLRIRLSDKPPNDEIEERGIHAAAIAFHAGAQLIDQASDGVKAFSGIVAELIAGDPSVVLIDEPEAFLHPSLASKLGNEISRAAMSSDKRVFVSTHSPTFVMGCIQSGAPVTIVRLTYRRGVATARVLPSAEILKMMRHPLLRSTDVLSGLFYEFVVVTESDADRAFYQEVNERLLQFRAEWGVPNCLFLNAQNKQTIPTIVRPLRKLGIPAVSIVDLDVLKDGGSTWTNVLSSADIPEISHPSFATMRGAVKLALESTGKDMKREVGVAILEGKNREVATNLLSQLAEYGVFIVPGGELESWMKHLAACGHGPNWLVEIFEKMGEDPASMNYVKPTEEDVWKFLSDVGGWLVNPNRKGMPV